MSARGAMTVSVDGVLAAAPTPGGPGAGVHRLGRVASAGVHGAAAAVLVVALLAPVLGNAAGPMLALAWVFCIPVGVLMLMLVSAARRDWGSGMRLAAALFSVAASAALMRPAADAGVEIHAAGVAARLDPLARELERAVRRGDPEWEVPPGLRPLVARYRVDVRPREGVMIVRGRGPYAADLAFVVAPGPVSAVLRRNSERDVQDVRYVGGRWYAFHSITPHDYD